MLKTRKINKKGFLSKSKSVNGSENGDGSDGGPEIHRGREDRTDIGGRGVGGGFGFVGGDNGGDGVVGAVGGDGGVVGGDGSDSGDSGRGGNLGGGRVDSGGRGGDRGGDRGDRAGKVGGHRGSVGGKQRRRRSNEKLKNSKIFSSMQQPSTRPTASQGAEKNKEGANLMPFAPHTA